MAVKITKKFLIKEYVKNKRSAIDIANELNVDYHLIYRKLEEFNIKTRVKSRPDITENLLHRFYIDERKTIAQIADHFNCNPTSIRRKLLKFNIKIRKPSDYSFEASVTKNQLKKLYKTDKLSIKQISNKLSCSKTTVRKLLRKHGLRNISIKQNLQQDLSNKKIGSLLVIEIAKFDDYGRVYWKCLCDCGNITEPSAASLLRKKKPIQSCGCNIQIRKNDKIIPQAFFKTIKRSANGRKIPFNLTIDQLESLFVKQNGKCALSGLEINFCRYVSSDTTASLDRIDSTKGYTVDNIQWVHKIINIMKGRLTNEVFIEFCSHVQKRYQEINSGNGEVLCRT